MRTDRVLLIGATGMLGAPVAQRLQADGWRVRCLVRDVARARAQLGSDVDLMQGDVTRPETLDAAFEGCGYLHLNLRGTNTVASYELNEVRGAGFCIAAAGRHGIRRITYLSGAGRASALASLHFPIRIKQEVERALAAGSVSYTAFRATHFMESLPMFVRKGRAAVLGRQPHSLHYVAASDYASMVSRAFECAAAHNRALYVFGPQAWTMRQALAEYLRACHPGLRPSTLPLPLAHLLARASGDQDLRFAAQLFAAFQAIGEEGDPKEANRLLGAPTTTLAQWLASQRQTLPISA